MSAAQEAFGYGEQEWRPQEGLYLGGCSAWELADQFGTPLLVLAESEIRSRCRRYRRAMESYAPGGRVIYAGKAFLNTAMAMLVAQEGLCLDVVSGGELYIALNAGFPPERVVMHGNNKTPEELSDALEHGVGTLVVDNFPELLLLEDLARSKGKRPAILLRLIPGVEAHTHEYIRTGQADSKFGISLEQGQAMAATRHALASLHVQLLGFHCHIGSQILALDAYLMAVEAMMDFIGQVARATGWTASVLDMGGGLGIRYLPEDTPPSIETYLQTLAEAVRAQARRQGVPVPRLWVEPGRSIVGEAGTALYRVGSVKEAGRHRLYAAVDGGMTDNPRVALYQARYQAWLLKAPGRRPGAVRDVTVAGHCCESGDILVPHVRMSEPERGDLVAIPASGAYQYAMSSNYNGYPRPAVVLVRDGRAMLIARREAYPDLVRLDLVPPDLRQRASEPADQTGSAAVASLDGTKGEA